MGSTSVKWSTLPGDILSAIANLLDPNSDLQRIRAVCSTWRSNLSHLASVCPSPTFPIKVPLPGNPNSIWNRDGPGSFFLNESIVYSLFPLGGSSGDNKSCSADNWMIKVSKSYHDSMKYSLLVPLSLEKLNAPNDSLPKSLNRLNYDVTEICRSYNIRFLNHGESSPATFVASTKRTVVLRNYVIGCDFVVLIVGYAGTIKFWRIGDTNWTKMKTDKNYCFDDVVLFEGKYYAIDKRGKLFLIDSSLRVRPIKVVSSFGYHPEQNNHLVVGLDSKLYVVVKISSDEPDYYYYDGFPEADWSTFDMPIRLRIFKWNDKTSGWDHVDHLNHVFFLGDDAKFSVSPKYFRGCKHNCVYLTDECFAEDNEGSCYGEETGVYNLTTSEIVALASGPDYATFFWPPPSWFVTDDFSSGKTGAFLSEMSSTPAKWSSLQGYILAAIANLLDPSSDHHRIRAVCSEWRSNLSHLASIHSPLAFPIEVPPPCSSRPFWNDECQQGSFLLNECIVYRLSPLGGSGSSNNKNHSGDGWMFKVSKTYHNSKKYSLLVPLSLEKMNAPSGYLPKTLNRLKYDVAEICRSYNIRFLSHGELSPASLAPDTKRTIVLQNYVVGHDFVVLIMSYAGTIKFWRFGDTVWTKLETDKDYLFDDVLLFEGKCYAIDKPGNLVLIDSSLRVTEIVTSYGYLPEQNNYLVAGLYSELYMVVKISSPDLDLFFDYGDPDCYSEMDERMFNMPVLLKVYKLNKEKNDWEFTKNVGDQVFFLGDDAAFCVSSKDFKGCKRNSVYLTDEVFVEDNEGGSYGEDTGMYDLSTSESVGLAVGEDYATFMWPPPSWLVMDDDYDSSQ